jgi:hypothetical protein
MLIPTSPPTIRVRPRDARAINHLFTFRAQPSSVPSGTVSSPWNRPREAAYLRAPAEWALFFWSACRTSVSFRKFRPSFPVCISSIERRRVAPSMSSGMRRTILNPMGRCWQKNAPALHRGVLSQGGSCPQPSIPGPLLICRICRLMTVPARAQWR